MERLLLFVICLFAIIIAVRIFKNFRYKKLIEKKIHNLGGEMTSFKIMHGYFEVGPFTWTTNIQSVYYFEYTIEGKDRNGWVRFGLLIKPEWKL